MSIHFDFIASLPETADTLVLTIFEDLKLGGAGAQIDSDMKGLISAVLERQKSAEDKFTGKFGQTLVIQTPLNVPYHQVILLGLGKLDKDHPYLDVEEAGSKLFAALKQVKAAHAGIVVDIQNHSGNKLDETGLSVNLLSGLELTAYEFKTYKTLDKENDKEKNKDNLRVTFQVQDPDAVKAAAQYALAEAAGIYSARDLGNEPANELYPESFAQYIQKELTPLGVKVTILDEKKLKKMGAGAFMAVGQGSENQPRMVIMEWKGLKGKSKADSSYPLALVGKGITFDTGGISLKPGAGMQDMKMDMCGAAAVVGAMRSLAMRKSPSNIIAAVALAENMPSHNAYRPGDIVKSLSGKTIEIHNTDAEGRLVLADTLTYVQQQYKPKAIIDLATLTGAMMVALGAAYCGVFANDDDLWAKMADASDHSGEKLWRMPLDEVYRKEMESDIADLKNLGTASRFAGACTAAGFLEAFIEPQTQWSHMDIAGVAWAKMARSIYPSKGATGFGVRVLNRLVEAHYE